MVNTDRVTIGAVCILPLTYHWCSVFEFGSSLCVPTALQHFVEIDVNNMLTVIMVRFEPRPSFVARGGARGHGLQKGKWTLSSRRRREGLE